MAYSVSGSIASSLNHFHVVYDPQSDGFMVRGKSFDIERATKMMLTKHPTAESLGDVVMGVREHLKARAGVTH